MGHNVFYHEVGKRLTSRLFLALGSEGKKIYTKESAHGGIQTQVSGDSEIGKNHFRKDKMYHL